MQRNKDVESFLNNGHRLVPQSILDRAERRYQSLRGESGRYHSNLDEEMVKAMREYGTSEVDAIITKAIDYGMTQAIIDYDKLTSILTKFITPTQARNLRGRKDYEWGLDQARKLLRASKGLQPLSVKSIEDLGNLLPKKDASSGYLGLVTGKRDKGDNLGEIFQAMNSKLNHLETADYSPIVIATRNNIKGIVANDELNPEWACNTRGIHMISAEDVACEMITAKPLTDHLCSKEWYAGGKDGDALTCEITRARARSNKWISIDYSSYDATIPLWLIRDAFNLVFELFGDTITEEYKEFIIRGFSHARILLPGRKVVSKQIGVPSGSYFTQIIDSVCNIIMIKTFEFGKNDDYSCHIMGDDNLIFSSNGIALEDLSAFLSKNFGVICNADKCGSGLSRLDDPNFLSRTWTRFGAKRDIREIVVKAIQPERYRNYAINEYLDARQIIFALSFVYPLSMKRYFDMDQLRTDLGVQGNMKSLSRQVLDGLPGSVKYKIVYLDDNKSLLLNNDWTKLGKNLWEARKDRSAA